MAAKGLQAKKTLSDELAEFMGKDKASRPEITKEIWKYIKENDLNDGRTINPDDALATFLGSKSFDMMKLPGKLSEHILD